MQIIIGVNTFFSVIQKEDYQIAKSHGGYHQQLEFLRDDPPFLHENVLLEARLRIWILHDAMPQHLRVEFGDFFNQVQEIR